MKKLISKISILLICLSLVLAGCTEANEPSNTSADDVKNGSEAQESTGKENRQRQRPDMFGRVKSIIGNEIVLEIAEMPKSSANNSGNEENKGTGAPGGNGGNGSGQRAKGAGMKETKLTGETTTLLIPVGIPINTRSQGGIKVIDLADIYVGATLQIWFEDGEAESKTITNVVMMQGRE